MMEYKIYKSPWKAIKLLVGCSLFVAAGIFILTAGKANPAMAWLTIIFLAWVFLSAYFNYWTGAHKSSSMKQEYLTEQHIRIL
jgi:hypothetical protein